MILFTKSVIIVHHCSRRSCADGRTDRPTGDASPCRDTTLIYFYSHAYWERGV